MLQAEHTLGSVEECDSDKTEWTEYKERLYLYLKAKGLAGNGDGIEEQKAAIFLTIIGSTTYRHLRSLTSPELPATNTLTKM